jgi:hypothetical protein
MHIAAEVTIFSGLSSQEEHLLSVPIFSAMDRCEKQGGRKDRLWWCRSVVCIVERARHSQVSRLFDAALRYGEFFYWQGILLSIKRIQEVLGIGRVFKKKMRIPVLALLLDWSLTWQIRINTSVHNDNYVYHTI